MHHFSVAFLERMAGHMRRQAPFHQARKQIPSLRGPQQVRCLLQAPPPGHAAATGCEGVLREGRVAALDG